jgi:hypothetical protein
MSKSAAFILDTKGFDKMVEALNKDKREPVLKSAMMKGASLVRENIRSTYKGMKPASDLDQAIVSYIYPSGEGAVVRRFYVKGGMGKNFDKEGPIYRSYILNFLEKGAKDRQTKGKGKRYAGKRLNRGSIPALKFFQRGRSRAKAFKEIERYLLVELAKQAMKA